MTDGIIPTAGTCDACGIALDDEDGYAMFDEHGAHRYCDNCPEDDTNLGPIDHHPITDPPRTPYMRDLLSVPGAVTYERPWLFVPGDRVLVLIEAAPGGPMVFSGVVQQVRIPGPTFGHPDNIVQVALDKDENAPLLPARWWHPDQVERIHA